MLIKPEFLVVDIVLSLVIIIISSLIYFKTKELYELSKHKGIQYFRQTFLFFSLAYFFRLLFHLSQVYTIYFDIYFPREIHPFFLIIAGYLSTIAIIYLIHSIVHKHINYKYMTITSHIVAIVISVLAYTTRSPQILATVQLILIVTTLLLAYFRKKHSKNFAKLFTLYLLMCLGWTSSLISLGSRFRLPYEIKVLSHIISIIIFIIVFVKVRKWTK